MTVSIKYPALTSNVPSKSKVQARVEFNCWIVWHEYSPLEAILVAL
jgi:hypothetical protein